MKKKIEKGDNLDAKFVQLKDIVIAGFVIKTTSENGQNFKDVPAFWQEYMKSGNMEKLHSESFVANHDEYGACLKSDENGNFEYIIGVEIKENADVPKEFEVRTLPATEYAVFNVERKTDDFSFDIQMTWSYIWNGWLNTTYRRYNDDAVSFELYKCTGDEISCDVYIPIFDSKEPFLN